MAVGRRFAFVLADSPAKDAAAVSRLCVSANIPEERRVVDAGPVSWPAGVSAPEKFQTALDFARHQDGHLFVTGRAGTGKSTLLRCLRDMITQEAVVLAPTGLAAVNVG